MSRHFSESYHVSKRLIKRARFALAKKFTGWTFRTPKLSDDMEIHLLLNSSRRKYNLSSSSYKILDADIRELKLRGIHGRFPYMTSGLSEESEVSTIPDEFDMKYIRINDNGTLSP